MFFYHDDTLSHEIRIDQYYCADDTAIIVRKMIGGKSSTRISGSLYLDENSDCYRNQNEVGVNAVPIKLYDSTNQQIALSYSLPDGSYYFQNKMGPNRLVIDTANLPIELICPSNKNDTLLQMGYNKQDLKNLNFGFNCTNAFDLVGGYCRFIYLKPGVETQLIASIYDVKNNLIKNKCGQKISCRVVIKVNGPVQNVGIGNGGIFPDTIAGNSFTYLIDDVSKLNQKKNNFSLIFYIDSTASINDTVKTALSIYPPTGDINSINNGIICNQPIRNSYDPNYKEVFPAQVKPAYSDWLNYTLHFQNTGNDSAIMIRLRDTLSSLLDIETFELMGSSHRVETNLNRNALMFFFRDIMLPDSATDAMGSQGFVQYRIKPKKNLTEGTKITNKAFIYFDYNSPIITNTAIVEYKTPKQTLLKQINYLPQLNIYPNPGTGLYTIDGRLNSELIVYNIYGQVVYTGTMTNSQQVFDFRNLANGFYLVKMDGANGSFIKQ